MLPTVKRYVVMTDAAHMPRAGSRTRSPTRTGSRSRRRLPWPAFDENTAAGLCYTSGTTGNPKGVLYSHRSNVMHSMMAPRPRVLLLRRRDSVLPVVPMFHANSWGLAFSARCAAPSW